MKGVFFKYANLNILCNYHHYQDGSNLTLVTKYGVVYELHMEQSGVDFGYI
jgi:hypothetical protein